MNILFIGDIVGRPGRNIVFDYLSQIKKDYAIDFTIVNGENSAHGKGITKRIYSQLIENGVDCVTMGNHSFSKSDIIEELPKLNRLIVPYNNNRALGTGARIFDIKGLKVCVCNILGEVFMNEVAESPFAAMEDIIKLYPDCVYIVDFHAEATSEKLLFAHYFQDYLLATLGTHTHVQTADERLIGRGAYISDVGMCGAYDSIIGRDIQEVMASHIDKEKTHFTVAEGPAQLCAVVIEVDEKNACAKSIKRIYIRPKSSK